MRKLLVVSSFIIAGFIAPINYSFAGTIPYCGKGVPPKNNNEFDEFRNAKLQLEKYLKEKDQEQEPGKAKAKKPTVFHNREGKLPKSPRMVYYEFPLGKDRKQLGGQHRAVIGYGDGVTAYYYTTDHYDSFCRIPD